MIDRTDIHRWQGRMVHAARLALPFTALLVLLVALPVEAQARRTRPSGGTRGTAGGTGSGAPATTPPATKAPVAVPSGADRTRPSAGQGGSTVVERDERSRPGSPGRDVVIVNPWGWWHSYAWRYGWGPWGWSGYGPYGGYYGPYGPYGPAWSPRRVNDRMGALDLDLKPGDTEIWLDGQPIGIADRFDGWPGYLWLEEGDYHFVFYREGYRTIAREYRIHPGLVIDVVDRLDRGESVPPEELVPPQPTPRRDARMRRNEELRRATAATDGGETGEGGDWRDRAPTGSSSSREDDVGVGTLRLVVRPLDASVYLDGRFLGTGDEVARLRRGLAVSAGEHLLEVVRPGHAPLARRVVLDDGEDLELEVELEPRP